MRCFLNWSSWKVVMWRGCEPECDASDYTQRIIILYRKRACAKSLVSQFMNIKDTSFPANSWEITFDNKHNNHIYNQYSYNLTQSYTILVDRPTLQDYQIIHYADHLLHHRFYGHLRRHGKPCSKPNGYRSYSARRTDSGSWSCKFQWYRSTSVVVANLIPASLVGQAMHQLRSRRWCVHNWRG